MHAFSIVSMCDGCFGAGREAGCIRTYMRQDGPLNVVCVPVAICLCQACSGSACSFFGVRGPWCSHEHGPVGSGSGVGD